MKNYNELRDKAMKWLKSSRDFNVGLLILQEAQFRPGVVGVLVRQGASAPSAAERLKYHIRQFIDLWSDKDLAADTDVKLGVVEGKELANDNASVSLIGDKMKEELEAGKYPDDVSNIIRDFRAAYVERDKLHRELADMPTDNNAATVEKRKALSDKMEELTDKMDRIYPRYKAYIETGTLESEPAEDTSKRVNIEDGLKNLESLNKDELQRLRKSIWTKIKRSKNMLNYQQETEGDELNEMPNGKKRVKYESKIARLSKEFERIEMAIAKLG